MQKQVMSQERSKNVQFILSKIYYLRQSGDMFSELSGSDQ